MQKQLRTNLEGYIFISPWLLGFFLFIVGPMLYALYISLFEWNVISTPDYVGFSNYIEAFTDHRFKISLKKTFYFVFASVPLRILIGLTLALFITQLLKRGMKGSVVFRTLYALPIMFSEVVLGVLWAWIFEPTAGILNEILRYFGLEGRNWLADPDLVMPSVIVMMGWRVGGMLLIFLAGLLEIPEELYESADIDGARSFRKLISITLPMLSPTLFFNSTVTLIQSFRIFGEVFILTHGGPGNASLLYVINLYKEGFELFHMGYASALSWILFIIVVAMTGFLFWFSRFWVFYRAR
jgi:multiple sugar transport system permease protein